jgi:epoxyqueuosine reductase
MYAMTGDELVRRLGERGYASRMVGTSRLSELEEDIAAHVSSGALNPDVVRERLEFFDFHPPQSLPRAVSVIVVAMPLPQSRLVFHWQGQGVPVAVPPAYISFDAAGRTMEEILTSILSPAGFHVAPVLLPEKLLAARSGLAAYGRNNITYVPGMGSYLRFATFYSDLPLETEHWQEPGMLQRCESCRACERACPTSAIPAERFLLRAERCLVFHNERPGGIPFPAWIDPSAHGCLVGCLECQRACPENRRFVDLIQDAGEFTEEETALIVDTVPLEQLPPDLVEKLRHTDLFCLFGVLARNLRAVLSKPAPSGNLPA